MKPSQSKVIKPYPSLDSTFIEAVYKMETHELYEQQLKNEVKQKLIKDRAVTQLKAEIREILLTEPINPAQRSLVNAKVIKIERVIEDYHKPEDRHEKRS